MKRRLFTPGPTPVPEQVMLRMAEPLIHHRTPEFRSILSRVGTNLRSLFRTEQPVLTLTCSGTGGMEATFVSLFSPGEKIIAVNGGKFGERWVQMPKTFGLNAVELAVPWGKAVRPDDLAELLGRHPDTRAVYLTQSETSTGTATDVQTLAALVHERSDALVCVDGISSIGAMPLEFDAWGIDACVTGSQKGLMIPPGLAFVALSPRAVAATQKSTMPRFYLDLHRALKSSETNDTPWTPAISLILGLDAALGLILSEGVERIWERHRRLARALHAGVRAVGLGLFSEAPSPSVTAIRLPDAISGKQLRSAMQARDGFTIAGGQGDYADSLVRISHLGYYDEIDMIAVLASLERALAALRWDFPAGAGVEAVHRSFLSP